MKPATVGIFFDRASGNASTEKKINSINQNENTSSARSIHGELDACKLMQINVDYSADETRWALFECVFVALLVSPFSAAIYVKEMAGSFSLFLFIYFFYFDFLLRV